MSEQDPRLPLEIFLRDFLTELTRRERRVLLAVCAIGITIAKTGLVPSRISTLGIEFSGANQQTMLTIIAALVFYFLLEFVINAASDYVIWKTTHTLSIRDSKLREIGEQQPVQKLLADMDIDQRKQVVRVFAQHPIPKAAKPVVWTRVFFDLIFPPVLAFLTILILLTAKPPRQGSNKSAQTMTSISTVGRNTETYPQGSWDVAEGWSAT